MSEAASVRDRAVRELTLRGLVLGALITVVFTASNVYLGLKVGLTFASSIPAAVISMAVLRAAGGGGILENNMVQTQASAAGTLSSVIFVLPGLLMVGHWHGFPYVQVMAICAAGGILGVLFTIPLRRALVTGSALPYPEGTAAAEILRAGEVASAAGNNVAGAGSGLRELLAGGVIAAAFSLASGGLGLLADSVSVTLAAGPALFRLSTGLSLALVGAGYLVGIGGGLAILLGAVIGWGIAVPVLTAVTPHPAGVGAAAFATAIWSHKVRFIGAGTIAVAAIWTLLGLIGPVASGLRAALSSRSGGSGERTEDERTDRDLAPPVIIGLGVLMLLCLLACFCSFFLAGSPHLGAALGLGVACTLVCLLFGFLVAAACGYMAGIVGSSSSPISGIAILAVVLVSLLLLGLDAIGALPAEFAAHHRGLAIASVLFVTSAILAAATISNDNLQDLKTGQLVGATPWRQQLVLMVGVVVGAAVIPPVLNLLYAAYGFTGAMPRPGMDPALALAAPQATLMATIARGIFLHQLDWSMILIGIGLGVLLVIGDAVLKRRGPGLPVLAVGLGLYLPPTVTVTLVIGALLSWLTGRLRRGDAAAGTDSMLDAHRRRGVMLASGFIAGESLMGVALAAVIGASGREDMLSLTGPGYAGIAAWVGLATFVAVCAGFVRHVVGTAR
ncbi:OPT family oligopeptide transporter [Lichenicoccus sp.]|uniref:OPT family oligopeptide transporter n=1 Tax=Lichenicoccus sp. TaxID=2781899 RepID=UPI003D0ADB7E